MVTMFNAWFERLAVVRHEGCEMIVFKKKTDAEIAATPARVVTPEQVEGDSAPIKSVPKRGKAKKGASSDDETLL